MQRTANGQNKGSALTNIVSPSRFSPLLELGDNEFEVLEDTTSEAVEKEDIVNEVEEMEEGELVEDKVNLPKQDNGKGRKGAGNASHKSAKKTIVRARDLKFVGKQGQLKKSSVRKL